MVIEEQGLREKFERDLRDTENERWAENRREQVEDLKRVRELVKVVNGSK